MLNNNETFEALNPKDFGKSAKFIIGKHSGSATIDYYLRKEGIFAEKSEINKL